MGVPYLTASIVINGKRHHKKLSLNKRTQEDAQKELDEWRMNLKKKMNGEEIITDNTTEIINEEITKPIIKSTTMQMIPQFEQPEKITLEQALTKSFRKGTGNSVVVLASSFAGKTRLIKDLFNIIEQRENIVKSYMVGDINHADYDHKKGIIMEGIHPNYIFSLKAINDSIKKKYNFWLIFDDIDQIKNRKSEQSVRNSMLSFRNSNISALLSIQSIALVSYELSSQANLQFFGNINDDKEILKTIRNKLGSIKIFLNERNDDRRIQIYRELVKRTPAVGVPQGIPHFIVYMPTIDHQNIFVY